LFTGRRLDILDGGSLKIQYNRNRYYDPYSGRWLTHDPLGITPNPQPPNIFDITSQYKDGLSLYQYVKSNPTANFDAFGNVGAPCTFDFLFDVEERVLPDIRGDDLIFGQTWVNEWAVSTQVIDADECKGCWRVEVTDCGADIGWWYVSGDHDDPDESGNTSYEHERHHVNIFHEWWNKVGAKAHSLGSNCMCSKKAECYEGAIHKYNRAYRMMARAANERFDCHTYTGEPKEEACENAARLEEDALDALYRANQKRYKCMDM